MENRISIVSTKDHIQVLKATIEFELDEKYLTEEQKKEIMVEHIIETMDEFFKGNAVITINLKQKKMKYLSKTIYLFTSILALPVITLVFIISLIFYMIKEIMKRKTIECDVENTRMSVDDDENTSCCGDDMKHQDVKRCPTCNEMN